MEACHGFSVHAKKQLIWTAVNGNNGKGNGQIPGMEAVEKP